MPKLIKTWKELSEVTSPNYKLVIDKDMCSGWIYPIEETKETKENWHDHHVYLSTHTFYGHAVKRSTEVLQKYGFDVILQSWDIPTPVKSFVFKDDPNGKTVIDKVDMKNIHFADSERYFNSALDALIYSVRYITQEFTKKKIDSLFTKK